MAKYYLESGDVGLIIARDTVHEAIYAFLYKLEEGLKKQLSTRGSVNNTIELPELDTHIYVGEAGMPFDTNGHLRSDGFGFTDPDIQIFPLLDFLIETALYGYYSKRLYTSPDDEDYNDDYDEDHDEDYYR